MPLVLEKKKSSDTHPVAARLGKGREKHFDL